MRNLPPDSEFSHNVRRLQTIANRLHALADTLCLTLICLGVVVAVLPLSHSHYEPAQPAQYSYTERT